MSDGRRPPDWLRIALAMLAVGWGANQFAPLLTVYRSRSHLSESSVTAMLGIYALGLIPSLLIAGPLSDRHGRRTVLRPVLVLSAVASGVLIAGSAAPDLLYLGRVLAGVASGFTFAAGTAWVKERSAGADAGAGARRAAIALSAGFGGGPLIAGAVAQWAPDPRISPYIPHLLLVAVVVPLVWRVPDDSTSVVAAGARRWPPPAVVRAPFATAVAPWAPAVFGVATVAFATLPSIVAPRLGSQRVLFDGAITGLTLLAGICVQPAARRLGRERPSVPTLAGLGLAVVGLVVAAVNASSGAPALVPVTAILLGGSYGMLLVSGLRRADQVAGADDLAATVAVFYALTYVGFGAPFLLSAIGPSLGYSACLLVGAGLLAVAAAPVVRAS